MRQAAIKLRNAPEAAAETPAKNSPRAAGEKPQAEIALDLKSLIAPYRKHRRLTLRIEKMPQLARLSAGQNNGDNSWSLALHDLDGLSYFPPDGFNKDHVLVVRVIAQGDSDASTIALLDFPVLPEGKGAESIKSNLISMRIQPDEGISLRFGAKVPGAGMNISPVNMDFSYAAAFGKSSANGYERLLLDAMLGDATLFAHRDGVEATWALITPILQAWAKDPVKDFPNYAAGTWGPSAADALLESENRKWRKL